VKKKLILREFINCRGYLESNEMIMYGEAAILVLEWRGWRKRQLN